MVADQLPVSRAAGGGSGDLPGAARLITAFVWATVLLQRIAFPVGDGYVSPLLPLALALAAWLWCTGRAYLEPVRALLCHAAIIGVLMASLAVNVAGARFSLLSLGLLLALYLPFVLVLDAPARQALHVVFRAVRSAATLVAVLALAQLLAQLAGVWTWSDLLAQVVPARYLVPGYITSYPITFGSSVFKSNGVLLLEPSVCSQVLALGIVSQLGLGGGRWRIALLGAALLSTVAGTGVIVLGAGMLVHVFRRGVKQAVGGLAVAAVVGAGVAASPLSEVYSGRLETSSSESSSAYQRFVAPLERMGRALDASPRVALAGSGAGSAQVEAERIRATQGVPAIDSPQSKLVTEYGWPAALLFVAFLVVVLVRGSPSPVLAASLAALYFVLGGGLLQAQTVVLIWVMTLPFAGRSRSPSDAPADDRAPSGHPDR